MKINCLLANSTRRAVLLVAALVLLCAFMPAHAQADERGRSRSRHVYRHHRYNYGHGYYGYHRRHGYWRHYRGRRYWYEGGAFYPYPGGVVVRIRL